MTARLPEQFRDLECWVDDWSIEDGHQRSLVRETARDRLPGAPLAGCQGEQVRHVVGDLEQLKAALDAGDYSLERVRIEGLTAPPVGWYLDTMLPAINGHITEHRADWNTLDDPAEIEQAIIARIAARRQQ